MARAAATVGRFLNGRPAWPVAKCPCPACLSPRGSEALGTLSGFRETERGPEFDTEPSLVGLRGSGSRCMEVSLCLQSCSHR